MIYCPTHGRAPLAIVCDHIITAMLEDKPLEVSAVEHEFILGRALVCGECASLLHSVPISDEERATAVIEAYKPVCFLDFREWCKKHALIEPEYW